MDHTTTDTMQSHMRDAEDRMQGQGQGMQRQMKQAAEKAEGIPTNVYLGGVFGSIAASALLMVMGKKNASIFVGLWPPTILNLAMIYKQVRPSREFSGSGY
jgi:hypothetical protein